MKAKRFIYIVLAVVVNCGFATSCDNDDELKRDPAFYDGQTIIHEMSEEDQKLKDETSGGGGMLEFELQSDCPFHAEVTPVFGSGIYEIYVPSQAMTMNIVRDNYYWLGVNDKIEVDDKELTLKTEWHGFEEKNVYGNMEFQFYKKSNEYLTATHTEEKILTLEIPENKSDKTRRISLKVYDGGPIGLNSRVIFLQERK